MEFIKNNQCLKIRLKYDYESGHFCFREFIAMNCLESIGGNLYAYFPDSARWTEEEINGMTEEERQEWQDIFDWDWTRYTLADVSWKEWFEVAQEEDVLPYRYIARGHSQSDWAHLYPLGMEESEAETLVRDFEVYAYDTPCYFDIDLIDCVTGKVMDSAGLGGIYDPTPNFDHLKAELVSGIKSLSYLDDELKTLALEAVQDIDYTNIDNNF